MIPKCPLMIALILALLSFSAAPDSAGPTIVDLFRSGNASSPRLDNVRPQDVGTFQRNGQLWVEHALRELANRFQKVQ